LPDPRNPPTPTTLPAADPFDYDAALMACARGDRQALQQLYQRESRYLMGVALRIVRQRQQAEDVLHDAFISIWQRMLKASTRARGEGRGWIYSVVRNAALNMVRSGARQVQRERRSGRGPRRPGRDGGLCLVGRSVRAARRPGQARRLPERTGAGAARLHPVMPMWKAARTARSPSGCNTPLGTVKSWIQRGMRALRECMA
jgi:DNA-directed RNA polymerase specialized sigma24 family protein